MYKLALLESGNWVEHIYPAVYHLPESDQEIPSLVAGVPNGNPEVFGKLVESLKPPYFLLYILHTPRGEGSPGRYQSPLVSTQEFQEFMARFGPYFSGDARFDLWAYSPAEDATVVWDRHNQIFAYGPLDRFEEVLQGLGFNAGTPCIPVPHAHAYREEYDPQAALVLHAFEWSCSPLHEEDRQ
jgi:hypothetical protein